MVKIRDRGVMRDLTKVSPMQIAGDIVPDGFSECANRAEQIRMISDSMRLQGIGKKTEQRLLTVLARLLREE